MDTDSSPDLSFALVICAPCLVCGLGLFSGFIICIDYLRALSFLWTRTLLRIYHYLHWLFARLVLSVDTDSSPDLSFALVICTPCRVCGHGIFSGFIICIDYLRALSFLWTRTLLRIYHYLHWLFARLVLSVDTDSSPDLSFALVICAPCLVCGLGLFSGFITCIGYLRTLSCLWTRILLRIYHCIDYLHALSCLWTRTLLRIYHLHWLFARLVLSVDSDSSPDLSLALVICAPCLVCGHGLFSGFIIALIICTPCLVCGHRLFSEFIICIGYLHALSCLWTRTLLRIYHYLHWLFARLVLSVDSDSSPDLSLFALVICAPCLVCGHGLFSGFIICIDYLHALSYLVCGHGLFSGFIIICIGYLRALSCLWTRTLLRIYHLHWLFARLVLSVDSDSSPDLSFALVICAPCLVCGLGLFSGFIIISIGYLHALSCLWTRTLLRIYHLHWLFARLVLSVDSDSSPDLSLFPLVICTPCLVCGLGLFSGFIICIGYLRALSCLWTRTLLRIYHYFHWLFERLVLSVDSDSSPDLSFALVICTPYLVCGHRLFSGFIICIGYLHALSCLWTPTLLRIYHLH